MADGEAGCPFPASGCRGGREAGVPQWSLRGICRPRTGDVLPTPPPHRLSLIRRHTRSVAMFAHPDIFFLIVIKFPLAWETSRPVGFQEPQALCSGWVCARGRRGLLVMRETPRARGQSRHRRPERSGSWACLPAQAGTTALPLPTQPSISAGTSGKVNALSSKKQRKAGR